MGPVEVSGVGINSMEYQARGALIKCGGVGHEVIAAVNNAKARQADTKQSGTQSHGVQVFVPPIAVEPRKG